MSDHYEYPYPSTELESQYPFYPYDYQRIPEQDMQQRALSFFAEMNTRRSIRMFSSEPVPQQLIELAVRTASTAPSGAHKQPWTFVATQNQDLKKAIRDAAEEEERTNYLENRMNADWQHAIAPLGTDHHKEFVEIAPWIVVLFEQRYEIAEDGSQLKNYYVKESVGIAAGLFIAA
ncbi:MAG: nitroreductase family protein, partial [Actinomycetota bacterium]|nr:nitroreductase family protein [Actinomycetota bacterium]